MVCYLQRCPLFFFSPSLNWFRKKTLSAISLSARSCSSVYVNVWVCVSSLVAILWVKIPADAQQPDSEVKHFRACFHWFIAPGTVESTHWVQACVCVCMWARYRQKVRQKACMCMCLHPNVSVCVSVSVCTRCYCPKQSFRPACVSWLGAQSLRLGC